MKNTLLDDLEEIYSSIKCEGKDGSYCECCKNKSICDATIILICSIIKYYKKFL